MSSGALVPANNHHLALSERLVQADGICDYIPIISTISNLVGLVQKYFFIPSAPAPADRYYTHLHQKNFYRCLVLLIPVLGNILVGLHDFANRRDAASGRQGPAAMQGGALAHASASSSSSSASVAVTVASTASPGAASPPASPTASSSTATAATINVVVQTTALSSSSSSSSSQALAVSVQVAASSSSGSSSFPMVIASHPPLRSSAVSQGNDDFNSMVEALEKNPRACFAASPRLKNDKSFMLIAIGKDWTACHYAGNLLKEDPEFMLSAVRAKFSNIKEASSRLKSNPEFMLEAIKENLNVLPHMSDSLKDNPIFMLNLVREVGAYALSQATDRLKDDLAFMSAAGDIDPQVYRRAGPTLRRNPAFLLRLIAKDPRAVHAADPELLDDANFVFAAGRICLLNLYAAGDALRAKKYPADPLRRLQRENFIHRAQTILARESQARQSGATVADLTFQEWHRHPSSAL